MPRDALANPVVLATLGALLERPMHAYQLAGVLAGRGVPVNRGSLYDTLDATTRAGWTEPRAAERTGARPQRTPYALTEAGRAELARRLDAQVRAPRQEFPEFLGAVSHLGVLGPERAADALAERAGRLDARIAGNQQRLDEALASGSVPACSSSRPSTPSRCCGPKRTGCSRWPTTSRAAGWHGRIHRPRRGRKSSEALRTRRAGLWHLSRQRHGRRRGSRAAGPAGPDQRGARPAPGPAGAAVHRPGLPRLRRSGRHRLRQPAAGPG